MMYILLSANVYSYAVEGRGYVIEITSSSKVIHVERLGMSDNTSVLEVLQSMPELLDRSSSTLLSNFEIQVDGISVGNSRDEVLLQTKLAQVQDIEISTSPTVSEQKNGEGGVINIKMKRVETEGISGSVMFDASAAWLVQPSLLLNYKKGDFVLRSSVSMEYCRDVSERSGSEIMEQYMTDRLDHTTYSSKLESAKLNMIYTPTANDELNISAWENYGLGYQVTGSQIEKITDVTEKYSADARLTEHATSFVMDSLYKHQLLAECKVSYTHGYERGGALRVNASYNYMPTDARHYWCDLSEDVHQEWSGDSVDYKYTESGNHEVMAEIRTDHPVYLDQTDKSKQLILKAGVNTTCMFETDSMMHETVTSGWMMDSNRNRFADLCASPFVEFDLRYGRWQMKAGARYRYYSYWDRGSADIRIENHAVTGNVNLQCQVADHHNLRVMAARNVNRSVEEVFPVYNVDLNYIFDWQKDEHYLVSNFSGRYIRAYAQERYSDVFCLNAQLYYEYGIFAMAFSGNVYSRTYHLSGDRKQNNWYYNLNLTPVLSLPKQWTLSGKFTYNSKINAYNAQYGDYFYIQFRLSKTIKNWNVHVEVDDLLNDVSYDTFYSDTATKVESYDMYKRALLVGFAYKF
ncbi:MAG: outer membrane beta-barrel family protein [Paludibacteraceae bacterium]|nr:outer membrane beta-barrel family protein [Paludibacteraceae bacterium]